MGEGLPKPGGAPSPPSGSQRKVYETALFALHGDVWAAGSRRRGAGLFVSRPSRGSSSARPPQKRANRRNRSSPEVASSSSSSAGTRSPFTAPACHERHRRRPRREQREPRPRRRCAGPIRRSTPAGPHRRAMPGARSRPRVTRTAWVGSRPWRDESSLRIVLRWQRRRRRGWFPTFLRSRSPTSTPALPRR